MHGPFFARTGSVQGQAISALHGFSRNGSLVAIHGLARTRDTCVPSCTEMHGLDGEPPLHGIARKLSRTKSRHGSHATTPNILIILWCNAGDSFCRHCSASPERARICTDWNSLKPPLHGVARTGCGAPLARSCTDLHGSADARTCTEKCNRTFQFTDLHGCVQLPFSIHGFAHHCTEASWIYMTESDFLFHL